MTLSDTQRRELLGPVLRNTSRSFYLTLRVLPRAVRSQVGAAYLLARAADTIADTAAIPREKRLTHLLALREQLQKVPSRDEIAGIQEGVLATSASAAEKRLLENLQHCFALYRSFDPPDRRLIAEVVTTLTSGMEKDLQRFHADSAIQHTTISSLSTDTDLDEYTYLVAGCVGKFWTQMCVQHLPALRKWDMDPMSEKGIRFGKGLQLTNILRDIPRDVRHGRCYLPADRLRKLGLAPSDLLNSSTLPKLRPLLNEYLDRALDHLDVGWKYTMAIPRRQPRLRLACIWPIWIGLETLAKIRRHPNPLDSATTIKVPREDIYKLMARSAAISLSDTALNRRYEKLRALAV